MIPAWALVIDAHQHFWRNDTYQTSRMAQAPYAGVTACITVEAADHPDSQPQEPARIFE
jgi:hypothetical protein